MNVFVTGGAGYIGSVTVELLLKAGHEVTVFDNLSRGHREAVLPPATLVEGELSSIAEIEAALSARAFDAVMHFAASSQVGESVADPAPYYSNNIGAGANLLKACAASGVRKLIFSSTAALFGEPASVPITEEQEKSPTNPYGRTKLYFESLLADADQAYGLKSVCLRYFNAAGATERLGEDHTPETHLIPLVLQAAAGRRETVSVYGTDYATADGTCVRDYIHVRDLAQAHLLALEHLAGERTSDAFNLGNGTGYSVREIIAAAERVTGKRVPMTEAPRRPGDPAVLIASSTKIQAMLGWKPEFETADAIIASAWNWMQAHPEGYRKYRG